MLAKLIPLKHWVKSGAAIPINQKSVFCCYSDLWSSVRDDDFESNFTLREVPDNITLR